MSIKSFPKIFAVGSNRNVANIFSGPVEITEKVDGSMFAFGKVNGELKMRSKGVVMNIGAPDHMFQKAHDYVLSIEDRIPDNTIFYCEYLNRPKHNVLSYDKVPKNNLVMFGMYLVDKDIFIEDLITRKAWAEILGIDLIPVLANNIVITEPLDLLKFLSTKSYLGGQLIEGVVVKNYGMDMLIGGEYFPIQSVKYVSEAFKEQHKKDWSSCNTGKGKWDLYKEGFCTEARWHKGIQHLRDNGELTGSPKDIGPLIKEIKHDIVEEEKENIKDVLWKLYSDDLLRTATRGFPEFYKEHLLKESFDG